jgi:hypothetical protein
MGLKVVRGAQEVKMLRLKLGNLAQRLHALEKTKTQDEEDIKLLKVCFFFFFFFFCFFLFRS